MTDNVSSKLYVMKVKELKSDTKTINVNNKLDNCRNIAYIPDDVCLTKDNQFTNTNVT